jgi:hypothetical protein
MLVHSWYNVAGKDGSKPAMAWDIVEGYGTRFGFYMICYIDSSLLMSPFPASLLVRIVVLVVARPLQVYIKLNHVLELQMSQAYIMDVHVGK